MTTLNAFPFRFIALLSVLALCLAACAPKTTTVSPPGSTTSPNTAVLVALDSAAAACTIAAPLATGPVSTWLSGPCAASMSAIAGIVEANGTAAQIDATIKALQVTVAALPPGTPDLQYANAALALATEVLTIYEQVTGQTVTSSLPTAAFAFAGKPKLHKLHWSKDEKARIAAIRVKLAKAVKK